MSHLLYIDDTMIFGEASKASIVPKLDFDVVSSNLCA